MTNTPAQKRAMPVAEIARYLNVDRSSLWRALKNDPDAPAPSETDDRGRPLYDPATIATWWPRRRTRGRPTASDNLTSRQPIPRHWNAMAEVPEPTPDDTSDQDQTAARWQDIPPEVRQQIAEAAKAVRDQPSSPERVAQLLETLRNAGLD